jgi:hypothetical protein
VFQKRSIPKAKWLTVGLTVGLMEAPKHTRMLMRILQLLDSQLKNFQLAASHSLHIHFYQSSSAL